MTPRQSFINANGPATVNAFKIAALYFLLGSAWIIISDLFVESLPDIARVQVVRWQTAIDLIFVILSALVLYDLSRRFFSNMKQSREAVLRSEQHLRVAMDNIPSIIVIYDAQLRFLFVNDMGVQIAALTRKEMLGRRDDELFAPESVSNYLPLLKRTQETRTAQSEECKVLLPDGRTVYSIVNYVPLLDQHGELVQIVGATHNITERRLAEEGLRRSEEQFRSLADNLPGMVFVCLNDADYTMLYMSSGAARILGYSPECFERGELSFLRLVHPADQQQVIDKVEAAVTSHSSFHVTYRFRNKSGQWIWLEEHGSGNYRDGKLESLQGFIRDVTQELHEQKNNKVLARLGHELASGDTMKKLGEAILTAASALWTWDAALLYVRQSGKNQFRAIVEADTFADEKQVTWFPHNGSHISVTETFAEPLLIHRSAENPGDPADRFGDESRPSASLMYATLRIQAKKVGMLSVQSYARKVFNQSDLTLLQKIADAAAPAIERCRAEERSRSFSMLGEQLSGTITPEEAARIIASVADEMIGWDACNLHLYYPEEDRVDQLISYDEVDGKRTSTGSLRDIIPAGLVKRALTEGQLLILREPSETVPAAGVRPFGDMSRMSASLMWVPVHSSSGISGVFSIQSYTWQAYDNEDLQLFQALANHCSSTLERVRAQQSLRVQEQQYRQAITTTGAVPYQLNYLTNTYIFVGEGIEAITGWSASEFTTAVWNKMVLETVTPEANDQKDYIEIAQEIRDGKRTNWRADIRIRTRHGEERWVADTSVATLDDKGRSIECLGILQDITDRKKNEKQLLHNTLHDPLTGLANRVLLLNHIQQAIHRSQRRDSYHFALLFLDIDRFKNVNDSLGHLMGDKLLINVGQRLENCVRPGDTVARFAGDEFVVLLDDIRHPDDAIPIAEKILKSISGPIKLDGREIIISASIGIAFDSGDYTQPESILRDADNALYRAKARGKACYEIFDARMHQQTLTILETENDLRRALERDELRLHYQPIIDLISGGISGFEALLRWQHPTRGLVPPIEFIPLAEETRLIIPIGYWVMEEAARQLKQWGQDFSLSCSSLSMSVNLSVRQFAVQDLDKRLLSTVQELGLNPTCFNLELTESILMEKQDTIIDSLKRLRGAGFGLSLDDFGTGYSSLSYLHEFPISTIKIDRSFINPIGEPGFEREIVRSIIQMAGNLSMGVTAEGVETEGQLAILKELGCMCVQGYFLSKPLPADEATKLLAGKPNWAV